MSWYVTKKNVAYQDKLSSMWFVKIMLCLNSEIMENQFLAARCVFIYLQHPIYDTFYIRHLNITLLYILIF